MHNFCVRKHWQHVIKRGQSFTDSIEFFGTGSQAHAMLRA